MGAGPAGRVMSKEETKTTVWKCNLCSQEKHGEKLPDDWTEVFKRFSEKHVCDICKGELLNEWNAYCR